MYLCNLVTQPGETDNYTVSDHVKAILRHAKYDNIIDTVFINKSEALAKTTPETLLIVVDTHRKDYVESGEFELQHIYRALTVLNEYFDYIHQYFSFVLVFHEDNLEDNFEYFSYRS